jgi:hydrogenase nickel incorporation protein HypB
VTEPRMVQIRREILRTNDLLARRLRERFQKAGVYVISLVSAPGSGKTTLLAHFLANLSGQHRVGALVGDLATENDASRLARSGAL